MSEAEEDNDEKDSELFDGRAFEGTQSSSYPSTVSIFADPFTPGSELNAYTDADVVLHGVSNPHYGTSIAAGDVNCN